MFRANIAMPALLHRVFFIAVCLCAGGAFLAVQREAPAPLVPVAATEAVANDADDPAIWIHPTDPARSLILGTNKVAAPDGALYAFALDGSIKQIVKPLDRPNNVDVEYGLTVGGTRVDIAVVSERLRGRLRVFRVGEDGVTPIDGGGLPVLEGQDAEAGMPMGIALYRRPKDGAIFAIVAPKTGGTSSYLWQYRLEAAGDGVVRGTLVRRFGNFSGDGEIEAVAVDDALGYVYYSDELHGLRKWHADPDHADAGQELAVFGRDGFRRNREGIGIVAYPDGTGFIVCSDQIARGTELRVYRREGRPGRPHDHDPVVAAVPTSADNTDGVEVSARRPLDARFPEGVLLMMNSRDRNFQMYDVRDFDRRLRSLARGSDR